MKTRFLAFLLAALLLAGTAWAQSTTALVVSDTANVLDASLMEGIADINRQTERELNISYRVITKHFLGGAQAAAYARETRESYPNPDQVILLVMVIGEERYATSLGSAAQTLISQDTLDSLLASAFRQPFLNRDYAGALSIFTAQLAGRMQSASGKVIDAGGLYAGTALTPAATADPLSGFFREPDQSIDQVRRYQEESREAQQGDRGLSIWQIALIGFVLFKIFGKKSRPGQKRGCGPLGWIFGTWGISKFFGWRK